MKALTPFILLTFVGLSSIAMADDSKFEKQAETLLGRFQMKLGENSKLVLHGIAKDSNSDCTLTITNSSKISPTFPESSKSAQQIELFMEVANYREATKFTLGRSSKVLKFSNDIRVGASTLNISVKNKTGIGNGMMKQSLALSKSVGPHRSMTVSVTGFDGESLTCVGLE